MKIPLPASFVDRLRDDKRLEILVCSSLILTAVIIFLLTGGISCDSMKSIEARSAQEQTADSLGLEARLEEILSSIAGAGSVRVMTSASGGEITGVIIVARGAKDPGVRTRLSIAVTTLLGIGPDRVSVFLMDQ